ncbi:TetR/AcrR family transcriptional regulator [Micromonospora sp. NBC_01699]|uniref:TetR/AcrR family transcriptional regulator n=1 Tax=Micromonospora sp. NBC_01699 TaxID=2975984 RepID=UPI002E32C727|nr:TetR/AcrR family transcriptional regulator [Micromonospora sp. NBC_01699]
MSTARVSIAAGQDAPRGRIDKRQAILDAAIAVFARQGYAQSCVQEIAAEAGVAKPTVYNHLHDKETLFRHAMEAAANRAMAENLAIVERLADQGTDLRASLDEFGYQLLRCHCDDRSWALRRLLNAEVNRFPDLIDIVHGTGANRVAEALADRLARLTLAGRLSAADPVEAAEQLLALLTGPMDSRARLGTRPVPEGELRAVAVAAVNTFLRSYGDVRA